MIRWMEEKYGRMEERVGVTGWWVYRSPLRGGRAAAIQPKRRGKCVGEKSSAEARYGYKFVCHTIWLERREDREE